MHILVVTGASGVGKTTAVRALEARMLPGVRCFYFDSIGVPTPEAMRRDHGSGEQWQMWATQRWLSELDRLDETVRVAVLDGQTRPSFVAASAGAVGRAVHTVLLNCERATRDDRLRRGRGQPSLATDDMHSWSTFLREEADSLGLPVIETSGVPPHGVADRLAEIVGRLLAPAV